MASTSSYLAVSIVLVYLLWFLKTAVSNLLFSSLAKIPGPKAAGLSPYYRAYIEGICQISWHQHLQKLHAQYGPIVRVGPHEIHFSEPQAYHEIYNNTNRWDKEETLYHSFGEDRSSFGFLTYREAKERKDVLNRSFSARAILEAQPIVQSKIDELCTVFESLSHSDRSANLSYAFRCMTIDVITTYCFGTPIDAIQATNFRAPIIVAMDASLPAFLWFRHSALYKNMILKCPRPLSRIISPPTAGLVDLQEIIEKQITDLTTRPDTLEQLPHRQTIYHSLLDPSNHKSASSIPCAGSLYEEAQVLMFGGADTVGNTLMTMAFHLSQPSNRPTLTQLQSELRQAYPDVSIPLKVSTLESLPFLNAVIKESLRLSSGVISGLLRIVPPAGATILNQNIPPGTIVSIGSTFVHYNPTIFPEPTNFDPNRWLSNPDLDQWLVAFSRGPRSCLGINLAWMELRLATASVFRKFEMVLDKDAPRELVFKERFLPEFVNRPVKVKIRKVT